jgi:hypothetical protein
MAGLKITGFAAMVPRTQRRLLADNQAQVATNARLTSGALESLRDSLTVDLPGLSAVIGTIFRTDNPSGGDYWHVWPGRVSVARTPIPDNSTDRYAFTGAGEPRITDRARAIVSAPYPSNWYVLGVYPPATAPTVTPSGGSGATTSRSYRYTFVTEWGEESAPSPAQGPTSGKVDDTWALTALDAFPNNSFTVTSASWSGGKATYTVASTFGLRVGELISVAGGSPAGYNVSAAKITELTATTIKVAMAANPGAATSLPWTNALTRDAEHHTANMARRIYRTDANGVYRFVDETTGTTYNDTIADTIVAQNEALQTVDWEMPPADMHSIAVLASGAMVGLSGNAVCFSEPGYYYAWPLTYRRNMEHTGVALGVIENQVVIGTTGAPYMALGGDPASISFDKIPVAWPCLSARGMVVGDGVVEYPTAEGLASFSVSGREISTRLLYEQERQWAALEPETFVAAMYSGNYYCAHTVNGQTGILIFKRGEAAALISVTKEPTALYSDPVKKQLYLAVDQEIAAWDSEDGIRLIYDWMSKEFMFPRPINLGAAKVDADFTMTEQEQDAAQAAYDAVVADLAALLANEYPDGGLSDVELGIYTLGGDGLDEYDIPDLAYDKLQFQLWIDNKLKFSKTLTKNGAFRLPGGYRADAVAVRLAGNVKVLEVRVSESMLGLGAL